MLFRGTVRPLSDAPTKPARPPKAPVPPQLRWLAVVVLSLPLVLGVPLATWQVVRRATNFTERTEATVVRVEKMGSNPPVYCPTVAWMADGTRIEAELSCDKAGKQRTVGQTVPIRFDPAQPTEAAPDSWWALYGLLFPTTIGGLLAAALIFVVIRRKSPGSHDRIAKSEARPHS